MNKQRKANLQRRAQRYARALQRFVTPERAFEGGYRAAMRDARKAIFPSNELDRVIQLPGTISDQRVTRARLFLRPLR